MIYNIYNKDVHFHGIIIVYHQQILIWKPPVSVGINDTKGLQI